MRRAARQLGDVVVRFRPASCRFHRRLFLEHPVMLGKEPFDLRAPFQQHVGNPRRKALALADLAEQARHRIADEQRAVAEQIQA